MDKTFRCKLYIFIFKVSTDFLNPSKYGNPYTEVQRGGGGEGGKSQFVFNVMYGTIQNFCKRIKDKCQI